MAKEITFKISADGSRVESDAEGFQGQGCEEITRKVTVALGTLDDSGKKPEYYQNGGQGVGIGS